MWDSVFDDYVHIYTEITFQTNWIHIFSHDIQQEEWICSRWKSLIVDVFYSLMHFGFLFLSHSLMHTISAHNSTASSWTNPPWGLNDQWSLKSKDIFFLEYYLQKSSKHNLQLLQGPEVCYGKVWTCTFNASHSNLGFAYLTYLLIRQELARVLELLCTDWTRKPSTLANLTYYFSWPVQFSAGVNNHNDM